MLCRYERTIFKSDKGFCIFSYSTEDQSVPKEARNRSFYHDDKIHFTAIGYHLVASNAVEVELEGIWENSKHGLQLSVSMCKEIVPVDQAGILAYLSSGVIKGVGPEIAKAIVARFGDKTMEVLDKEPQKLLSIKGIAQRKLKAIIASYEETTALSDLMIYLAPFGVSMKKAAMIKEEFGDNSLKIVKSDPFQLCKIKGFGFMTVDSIARKTKVSLKHPMRYSGAINYVLDEARVSGHLFLTVDETVGQCYDLLNSDCEEEVVSEEDIRQAISNERVESRVYVEGSRVYLSYERMCEVKAAKRIVSMLLQEGFEEIDDLGGEELASEAGPFSAQCCEAVLVLSHIHHDWWTGQRQDDDAKVYLGHLPGRVPGKRDPFGCAHRQSQPANVGANGKICLHASLSSWSGHRRGQSTQRYGNALCRSHRGG